MNTETCPCCGGEQRSYWAAEAGHDVVRCGACGLLYVYPMPKADYVDAAVRTGFHKEGTDVVNVRSRRIAAKVPRYQRRIGRLLADVVDAGHPVTWVDVGSGYGEFLEALSGILPKGSRIIGIEPMAHKAQSAKERGLEVINDYLQPDQFDADFISNMDVFSHVPDYHSFLKTVASNLKPRGHILIETGNLADLRDRQMFPNELGLPDHLVFGGVETIKKYFSAAGFNVKTMMTERSDTLTQTVKNIVKLVIGRDSHVGIPYTSPYRQIVFRAHLTD